MTGEVQIPTTSFVVSTGTYVPQVLVYSGSLQYSMPYLKDLQLPDFINHLIPIVEAYGKVALITGACGEIGSATVRLMGSRGAQIVAVDRDPKPSCECEYWPSLIT